MEIAILFKETEISLHCVKPNLVTYNSAEKK